jgi:hypothetical protein
MKSCNATPPEGAAGLSDTKTFYSSPKPADAFKTTTRTATAEQSFWRYGGSAHGALATSLTATAIERTGLLRGGPSIPAQLPDDPTA